METHKKHQDDKNQSKKGSDQKEQSQKTMKNTGSQESEKQQDWQKKSGSQQTGQKRNSSDLEEGSTEDNTEDVEEKGANKSKTGRKDMDEEDEDTSFNQKKGR